MFIWLDLSSDWRTPTPWTFEGSYIKFFDTRLSKSKSGATKMRFLFAGPLCLVIGKMPLLKASKEIPNHN